MNRVLPYLVSVSAGCVMAALGAQNGRYGIPLFVGVPFVMGFLAVLLEERNGPVRGWQHWGVSLFPLLITSAMLLLWKIEGAICLAMAAPLAIPLGLFGGALARVVRGNSGRTTTASCLLLAVPLTLFTDRPGPHPGEFTMSTQIVINAPVAIVWKYVPSFPDPAPPGELIFRAGVAAPIGSSIEAPRVGAERICRLSTGDMRERISAWDPPYLLRFDVLSTPPAMKELSPWKNLDLPHLHGFYVSHRGEFRLTPLPGDRTLLQGTSWYSHGLAPARYWALWSDYVVHKVQLRVLQHVKTLAETTAAAQPRVTGT